MTYTASMMVDCLYTEGQFIELHSWPLYNVSFCYTACCIGSPRCFSPTVFPPPPPMPQLTRYPHPHAFTTTEWNNTRHRDGAIRYVDSDHQMPTDCPIVLIGEAESAPHALGWLTSNTPCISTVLKASSFTSSTISLR